MKTPRSYRFPVLPARSLAPNVLTVLALCAGMSAIRFAMEGRWEASVAAILVAGIFDGLDGRVARLLKGATKFGAELDSLSDVVSFGVAPALVLYMWTLETIGGMGWVMALIFIICSALRLARFNTAIDGDHERKPGSDYFVGVPMPAAAALALWPLILSFEIDAEFLRSPVLCAVHLALISFLTISSIPTFSFKRIGVRREYVLPALLGITLLAALLVSYLWWVMSLFGVIYLLLIPVSVKRARKTQQSSD
ncbi:MAG: CDP-diacylglycerol--serine O-phosphatidyltransferase [Kordiimonas sp.]|nr:CDP-diacylglycerol--serine O-phosphatidyltransferase [Kordiimonas sp.]|tara:strand:- start:411 stop:1166 length:756 start_codon:yes stop_codon:yes gene_type:complete